MINPLARLGKKPQSTQLTRPQLIEYADDLNRAMIQSMRVKNKSAETVKPKAGRIDGIYLNR